MGTIGAGHLLSLPDPSSHSQRFWDTAVLQHVVLPVLLQTQLCFQPSQVLRELVPRWAGCFSPSPAPHQSTLCFTALRWGSFSHLALSSIRCHSPHHPAARLRCSSSIQVRGATGQGWH